MPDKLKWVGVCAYDDVVEHCGPAAVQHLQTFMGPLLSGFLAERLSLYIFLATVAFSVATYCCRGGVDGGGASAQHAAGGKIPVMLV